MLKLKKPFSFLIIFLIFIFLIVLGISTYLLASGVWVKYDGNQKRYMLSVSKNEFVKNLFLKYSKNLVSLDEKTNETTGSDGKKTSLFGKIIEESSKSKDNNNPYNMVPDVVERFKDDLSGLYFFRIGWGVDKVSVSDLWDYTKSAFVAEIVDYNQKTTELSLKVILPTSMPYSGQTIKTKVNCNPEKSYLEKDGKVSNPIDDASIYFVPKFMLFTGQCTSEECSEVGPFCKVTVK
jgi:hypothetical protein